ncbi:MAG: hypothetical protein IJ555_14525 [Ruminococcus sp.]|nr:hypothetical protein [Ruminococcus sp.]
MNKTTEQSRLEILICYRGDYAPLFFMGENPFRTFSNKHSNNAYERSKSK